MKKDVGLLGEDAGNRAMEAFTASTGRENRDMEVKTVRPALSCSEARPGK